MVLFNYNKNTNITTDDSGHKFMRSEIGKVKSRLSYPMQNISCTFHIISLLIQIASLKCWILDVHSALDLDELFYLCCIRLVQSWFNAKLLMICKKFYIETGNIQMIHFCKVLIYF